MMKKVFALLLCLCMAVSSTAAFAEEDTHQLYRDKITRMAESMRTYYDANGESGKIEAYDEPITVNVVGAFSSAQQDAMSVFGEKYGESWDNTRWTELFRSLYNVNVHYNWWTSSDQYETKLRLEMASGDLPDIFYVQNQSDVLQLVEAEQIWDLTDLYNTWGSDMDKRNWESDGGLQLDTGSVDGRLYALPAGLSDTDLFSYFWIRKDWLDALNLDYPKTMDDLKAVMDAFMAADFDGNGKADTIGIGLDKDLYYSLRGLFSAFGAYPEFWDKQGDQLVWGGTTEQTKNALAFLADLYAQGYLDPEFITKSNDDMLESVLNGKCGIVYGGHWLGHSWGKLRSLDPNANMVAVSLPKENADAESVQQYLKPNVLSWLVVNKEFEHPEILFKMFAAADYAFSGSDADWWVYDENVAWNFSPVYLLGNSWENLNAWRAIQECFKTGDTSGLAFNAIAYWGKLHGDSAYEWSLMFGDASKQEGIAMSVLSEAQNNNQLHYEPYYGPTTTYMQDHWSTIQSEQLIAFTKIIIGETSVEDGFNTWLENFSKLGGDQVTAEVNEWYAAKQSSK